MTDALQMTPGIASVRAEKLGAYYALIGYSYRDRSGALQRNTLEVLKDGDRYLASYNPMVGDPFPRQGPSVDGCGVILGYADQPLIIQ